jgi:hypothetical protein
VSDDTATSNLPPSTTPYPKMSRAARIICWVLTLAMTISGVAFFTKIFRFSQTFWSEGAEMLGFALIPVTNYLCVAAGFFLLLIWAYLKGDFSDIERAKFELLEDDARYDAMEVRWRELARQGKA